MKRIVLLILSIVCLCSAQKAKALEFQHHIMVEEYVDFAIYQEPGFKREGFVHDMNLMYRFVARTQDNIALIASPLVVFNTQEARFGFKVGIDYQFK